MRNSIITTSKRKAAKIAGLTFLLTFSIVAYINFGIVHTLVVENDALETARNILANEQLFRIGIAGNLIYCIGLTILFTSLYVILKPVNQGLALLGTFWRMVWLLMWLLITVNLFDSLRLLTGAPYLKSFEVGQLQSLGRFHMAKGVDYYYVGLLFTALASTLYSFLWLKSGYIPKWIALFGIITSAFCVLCTFLFYIFPEFDKIVNLWLFDMPMVIFDTALSIRLLVKGLRVVEVRD
jgi:hypothetical protein